MKVIMVMVQSFDGKTTKWKSTRVEEWTSKEDQAHFRKIIQDAKLIIEGSTTYEVVKSRLKHTQGKLREVITRNPEKYANEIIPGQLEFTSEEPKNLILRLKNQGFTEAFLIGGSQINSLFLKTGVVTDLWITVEPKILGKGNGLVSENEFDVSLKLKSLEKLNSQGTLLLKYSVIN